MTRPARLVAQVRSDGHELSSARLVARGVALTAQANGWHVVDVSPGAGWGTAHPSRLAALPQGTPIVLHVGTGDDAHLLDIGASPPPGPVLVVHHGLPGSSDAADRWVADAVGGVALGDEPGERRLIDGEWTTAGVGAWTRLADAIVADGSEAALLAAHQGPHVTASGPLTATDIGRWIAMTSALVQELRPDATVAILPAGLDDPGPARQIAELGLASCQLTIDATAPIVCSHLQAPGVYLRAPGPAVDPVAGLARASGCRIVAAQGTPDADVHYESNAIASVAAAIDVALDLPRAVPTGDPDDTWLWPLLAAAAAR